MTRKIRTMMQGVMRIVSIGVQGTPYLARNGLIALALALPFVMVGKAEASEGKISIKYVIPNDPNRPQDPPYTSSSWSLTHHPDALEGLDQYDVLWARNPPGIASKMTSTNGLAGNLTADFRPKDSIVPAALIYSLVKRICG